MHGGMIHTVKKIVRNEGVLGLYRGLVPPLIGSAIFRSIQFGAYGIAYGNLAKYHWTTEEIPYTSGLQARVMISSVFASAVRSVVETPLELMKIRLQTGQSWRIGTSSMFTIAGWKETLSRKQFQELYQGFGITMARTCVLMTTFFILVDYAVRKLPDVVNAPLIGPFFKGGICATLSWLVVWPLEYVKSQIQANTTLYGKEQHQHLNTMQRLRFVLQHEGFFALYRGILPGCTRSLVANGLSMVVYTYCQALRHYFLDDNNHEADGITSVNKKQ